MNPPSSGPPNPRHARYRQVPVHWSGSPLTVVLIVISCLVAVFSQLGNKTAPVAFLYFSAQPSQELLERLQDRMMELEDEEKADSPEYEKLMEDLSKAWQPVGGGFAEIQKGQVWRLATPMFLHFGPLHLIFNMIWLWTLGRPLEHMLRRTRYILTIIGISIIANVAQAWFGQGTNFGGMSGVVYGLFGFVVVHARLHPTGGLYLDPRTVRFMMIWLLLCFTGLMGPIANWAHVFGLFAGGLIGALIAMRSGGWKTMRRRQEFRRAIVESSGAIHQCKVCGRTEHHDEDLEFRVGSDGNEYCNEHLPDSQN